MARLVVATLGRGLGEFLRPYKLCIGSVRGREESHLQ
jgi:hypothetical protein